MEYKIRNLKIEDIRELMHVIAVVWNETYKGIVPDEFLASLYDNEDERAERAISKFGQDNDTKFVLEIDGKIAGFTICGESRNPDFIGCGEIQALYILKKYHGYGLGRKLVNAAVEDIKKRGFDQMIIACLKGNPTNEFYKHIGGVYVKDGIYERLNLPENIYYFKKI